MPKIAEPLTEAKIEETGPGAKTLKLFDGGGLLLCVYPSGGKSWRLKYRFQDREKSLFVGTYPEVCLEEARSRRDAAVALLKDGIDPAVLRRQEKDSNKKDLAQQARTPSVRVTIEGNIELWRGSSVMRFTLDEARAISAILQKIVE